MDVQDLHATSHYSASNMCDDIFAIGKLILIGFIVSTYWKHLKEWHIWSVAPISKIQD